MNIIQKIVATVNSISKGHWPAEKASQEEKLISADGASRTGETANFLLTGAEPVADLLQQELVDQILEDLSVKNFNKLTIVCPFGHSKTIIYKNDHKSYFVHQYQEVSIGKDFYSPKGLIHINNKELALKIRTRMNALYALKEKGEQKNLTDEILSRKTISVESEVYSEQA